MSLSHRFRSSILFGAAVALAGWLADAGGAHAQSIRTRGYELQQSLGRGSSGVSSPPTVRTAPTPAVVAPPAVVSGRPGPNLARPIDAPTTPAVTGQFGGSQPGPVVVSPSYAPGNTVVSPAPYYRSGPIWYEWVPSRGCWLMHTVSPHRGY